jgi:hypothetical protein
MKDKSIEKGVKVLGEYKLYKRSLYWAIYEQGTSGDYYYKGAMIRVQRESNIKLYNSVQNWLEGQ